LPDLHAKGHARATEHSLIETCRFLKAQGLERLLDEREEEIAELEEQIFDKLFYARCGTWISSSDFAWTQREGGAHAYHLACGDHGPELMKPSSWLGWQSCS